MLTTSFTCQIKGVQRGLLGRSFVTAFVPGSKPGLLQETVPQGVPWPIDVNVTALRGKTRHAQATFHEKTSMPISNYIGDDFGILTGRRASMELCTNVGLER